MSNIVETPEANHRENHLQITEEWAENEVVKLYSCIMKRSPGADELTREASAIALGNRTPSDLAADLISARARNVAIPPPAAIDDLVDRVYRTLLGREPDASGRQSYRHALAEGRMDILDMIKDVIGSVEFAERCIRTPGTARYLVNCLTSTLMRQGEDELGNDAYCAAIEGGMALPEFVSRLMRSPGFCPWLENPAAVPAQHITSNENAVVSRPIHAASEALIARTYSIVLGREPDKFGLQSFHLALTAGEMDLLDVIQELINSAEFGERWVRTDGASKFLVNVIFTSLLRRQPDEEARVAYGTALKNGMALEHFIEQLLTSEEFSDLRGRPMTNSPNTGRISAVADLAGQLIADQLVREGCKLAFPPSRHAAEQSVDAGRLKTILLTLGMLADPCH
jgi:hypothetical protein